LKAGQAVPRRIANSANMIERIGQAIAVADGADFQADQIRYRRLAAAALKPLLHPTETMIDARTRPSGSTPSGPSTAAPISGRP
jgi:hypothetical protein